MSTDGGRRVSEPIAHKAPKSRDGVIKQMSPQSCGMAVEDDGFVEGLNNKIGYLYHRLLVAEFAAYRTATQKSDLLRFHFIADSLAKPSVVFRAGLLLGVQRPLVLHFSRSSQP